MSDFDDLLLEEFSDLHRQCFGGPLDGAWVQFRYRVPEPPLGYHTQSPVSDLTFDWPGGMYLLKHDGRYHWWQNPYPQANWLVAQSPFVRIDRDYPPSEPPRGFLA